MRLRFLHAAGQKKRLNGRSRQPYRLWKKPKGGEARAQRVAEACLLRLFWYMRSSARRISW